jgi:hypothetical protein
MNAGSGSEIVRLAPENSAALLREEFKNSLLAFMYLYLKNRLLNGRAASV